MDLQFASWGTRPLTNIIHFTDVVFRNVALHLSTLASRTSTWDVHRFRLNIFHILVNLRKQNYDPGYVFVALLYMKRSATDHAPLHLTSSEAERYFLGALLDAIHQVKPVRLPEPALWIYSTSYLKALRQQWCTKMHRRHYSVHPVLLKTFCDTILRHPEHTVIHGDIYPIFTDAEMLDERGFQLSSPLYMAGARSKVILRSNGAKGYLPRAPSGGVEAHQGPQACVGSSTITYS